jgi:hypothetical protein
LHDSIKQGFWSRWATWHIHINRNDVISYQLSYLGTPVRNRDGPDPRNDRIREYTGVS